MRRIHVIGAAAVALVLVAAVAAYAVPASQTTFEFSSTASPTEAGTKKKPKALKLKLSMKGETVPAGGSPATSTDIVIKLPRTLKWYGAKWPKSKQCNAALAEQKRSKRVCPRGSKVGSGNVLATAQPDPTKPKIEEPIKLTAYTLKAGPHPFDSSKPNVKRGTLGLWLDASQPVEVHTMLVGRISKRNTKISVEIPESVQQAVPGVFTGIEDLSFTLNGKTKVRGKTYGAVSSVGCKRKKWKTVVTNIYRDGRKKDSDTSPCSASEKRR
jgi:hypothetical protein